MARARLDQIRRAELVDAAARAIAEDGLERATVARIAARAEISPGIVHHYFGDKQGLIEATMRDLRRPISAAYLSAIKAGTPRLSAAVAAHLDPAILTPARAAAWTACALKAPYEPGLARILAASRCRQEAAFRQGFIEAFPDTDDPAYLARRLAVAVDGLWFAVATREGGLEGSEGLDELAPYLSP